MPQENGLLEMEGSVENIVYHNDSNQYTVLEVDCGEELITVVGTFPYVSVGERLHLYGTWTSHATFGQQFRAQAFERSRPADTAAMLKYLSSGAVKGIGGALAGRIIEAFGDESIKVIAACNREGHHAEKGERNLRGDAARERHPRFDGIPRQLWRAPGGHREGVEGVRAGLCGMHSGRPVPAVQR